MTTYSFTKTPLAMDRLTKEIQTSAITIALDHMNAHGSDLDILFRADLSANEQTILAAIVAAHDGTTLPENKIAEVVTQFEKRDKTLKIAHGEGVIDATTGLGTVLIKVPGTPGSSDGRWLSSGVAFFSTHNSGDKILSVHFTDEDNVMGGGAGLIIGSYTDDDAGDQAGWTIPPNGWIKAEAIGGYGFAPSGFYIKIIGKKSDGNFTGSLYTNVEWGKTDA